MTQTNYHHRHVLYFTATTTLFFHLVILTLPSPTASQPQTQQPSNQLPPPPTYTVSTSIATVIIIFVGIFILLAFLSLYFRFFSRATWFLGRFSPNQTNNTARHRHQPHGLDPIIIQSFPTFIYGEVKPHRVDHEELECAVCLSEFEDHEILRLLPKCDHVFHPECIDPWLRKNITCPVCRTCLEIRPFEIYYNTVLIHDHEIDQSVEYSSGRYTPQQYRSPEHQEQDDDQLDGIVIEEIMVSPVVEESNQQNLVRVSTPHPIKDRTVFNKFSRSHSTGHSLLEVDSERFTLRLPPPVRSKLMKSGSNRTVTTGEALSTMSSPRIGYRSGSVRSIGGRGKRYYERFGGGSDHSKKDKWGGLCLPSPGILSRGSSQRSDGVVEMGGTGTRGLFRGIRSPFDRIVRGNIGSREVAGGERSLDRLWLSPHGG